MDLVLSVILLVLFVSVVELTATGGIGSGYGPGVVDRLSALFASHADLGWPAGVQEDDDHRWPVGSLVPPTIDPSDWAPSAFGEILEAGVQPVRVQRVRRID
ncbi:MAG: hypothetical protein E6I94_00965 [Chloroflexi bacterium]|nr:MAG: hypothetical protein E6I94_00965 [Chloroflexota bacterium]